MTAASQSEPADQSVDDVQTIATVLTQGASEAGETDDAAVPLVDRLAGKPLHLKQRCFVFSGLKLHCILLFCYSWCAPQRQLSMSVLTSYLGHYTCSIQTYKLKQNHQGVSQHMLQGCSKHAYALW